MGSVAQAVVEFDDAVQAPWRPPLASAPVRRAQLRAVPDPEHRPTPPRVGVGRPPVPAGTRTRRAPARPNHRSAAEGPAPRRRGGVATAAYAPAPGVRLTRRARRLGVLLGLTVGVAVGSWVGSALTGGGEGLQLAGESSVVVQSGDTLWSIAATVTGEGDDVRAVVGEIRELNELSDAGLVPGQVLVLP